MSIKDLAGLTSAIKDTIAGTAKVAGVTREALAKSLEEMAADIRGGGLIPDELLAKVQADGDRLNSVREGLPD